jgi:phenylalanyl-tRNA synthetase beta chain
LHAFDNTRLNGTIHARMALPEEKLLLLNEQAITLSDDVLMIADDDKPLAMAGVMGGEESGITLDTTDLFLESAFFLPQAVAGRARRYSFTSDASHRFERGVDFSATRNALERATQLVLDICGGEAGPVTEARAGLPARNPVRLRHARVRRVLGIDIEAAQISAFFDRLGFHFTQDDTGFVVTPPAYRFDIEIEEDLIEEIARLHGYDNIPAPAPTGQLAMLRMPEAVRSVAQLKNLVAGRGYQEVVNYAFVEAAWERDFAGNAQPIELANPIASQMSVMRSSLIGGMVANAVYNLRRKQSRVRVFEIGRCFSHGDASAQVAGYSQPMKLGMLAYGSAQPEQWGQATRGVDFFDLKGDLEAILAPAHFVSARTSHPALHPGRSAALMCNGIAVGVYGELHPRWQQAYDLPQSAMVAELDLAALLQVGVPAFEEVSKTPQAVRDLAIVVDHAVAVQDVLDGATASADALVKEVRLFDLYVGKGVEAGRKSLALRIVMQDTQKTLKDSEVDQAVAKILAGLEKKFAATLRA